MLWQKLEVTLKIRNRIVGGIPTDPALIEGWIASNMKEVAKEEREKLKEATIKELPAAVQEKAEGMWTTFKVDKDQVPYFEARCIKASLKEGANVLRELLIADEKKGKKEGDPAKSRFTGLKAKLAERLFVEDTPIYFVRDGKKVTKVDGNEERAIHVMTAQGPRTALKRYDFVNAPCELKFQARFLKDKVIDLELLKVLLEYGSYNGLGADRSQNNGLFEVGQINLLD
jgi:hypothetical protein